jgi:hypothetical protein
MPVRCAADQKVDAYVECAWCTPPLTSVQLAYLPRRSPLSGDYKGHDEVVASFTQTHELAAGMFSIEINDMLANKTPSLAE